jgi:hypothetical protein
MKFSAKIQLRPNTEFRERFSNEKGLISILKGLFIKKEVTIIEQDFSAHDILRRLNSAFQSSGITNLIRVSHDDNEFYLDDKNDQNDLDKIINEFSNVLYNAFERFYEKIAVIMEIKHDGIDFMVELDLMRIHPVKEFPVQISITGIPESSSIQQLDKKFKLFVDKLETNICKYVEVADINQSFLKEHLNPKPDLEMEEKSPLSSSSGELFPLYGITLGESSISDLAKRGVKATDFDSENKPYQYYIVNDVKFWHNGKKADQMYITNSSPLPKKWKNLGFNWDLSFNEWYYLFQRLGFYISMVKPPKKEWYNGQQTLVGEFQASKKIKKNLHLSIEVYFNYSKKSSVESKGTIYSLRLKA